MQKDDNPPDKPIDQFSNFGEDFLDWSFLEGMDDFPCHDQHVVVQHEHEVHGEDADCLSDMWKNWLNLSSEAQSLDNVLGVPLSACISPLPNCSSQTSANFLPCSNTRGPELIKTSFVGQCSPLSSTTSPNYVANEHNSHSLNANDHANELSPQQLATGHGSVSKPAAPYSPPLEMNVMAPLSPPLIDVKTTAVCQELSYLKAKSSSCKKKQSEVAKIFRNNKGRTNKDAETYCLAETIEDGYIWHKYGQKSIKNRMHPRGYFKCAQPDCPVKKRTELAPDTQGSLLITYIGEHNHLRPVMTCREVL